MTNHQYQLMIFCLDCMERILVNESEIKMAVNEFSNGRIPTYEFDLNTISELKSWNNADILSLKSAYFIALDGAIKKAKHGGAFPKEINYATNHLFHTYLPNLIAKSDANNRIHSIRDNIAGVKSDITTIFRNQIRANEFVYQDNRNCFFTVVATTALLAGAIATFTYALS